MGRKDSTFKPLVKEKAFAPPKRQQSVASATQPKMSSTSAFGWTCT